MREDFLDWARRQKIARRQAERDALAPSGPTPAPGHRASGGDLPDAPGDTNVETNDE